ncbi:unnamed protein product [Cuscuta epithymum]|uniref:Uncharacterized protein n=1 Tax=Cuscuta epithymum TaxID=186058 RepID=A0AAV0FZT2_9ASTE|nr:unnamed protein product [Cuscuta epithymum]
MASKSHGYLKTMMNSLRGRYATSASPELKPSATAAVDNLILKEFLPARWNGPPNLLDEEERGFGAVLRGGRADSGVNHLGAAHRRATVEAGAQCGGEKIEKANAAGGGGAGARGGGVSPIHQQILPPESRSYSSE